MKRRQKRRRSEIRREAETVKRKNIAKWLIDKIHMRICRARNPGTEHDRTLHLEGAHTLSEALQDFLRSNEV